MGYREPGESLRERLLILGCCTGSFSYQEGLKKKKNRYGIHNMFQDTSLTVYAVDGRGASWLQ